MERKNKADFKFLHLKSEFGNYLKYNFFILENKQIIGIFHAELMKNSPNIALLNELFISDNFRNKGLASKLLNYSDGILKKKNIKILRLYCLRSDSVCELYKKHGFKKTTTKDKHHIWMRKFI